MKVHKYTSKVGPFYVLAPSSTKPIKSESVTGIKWSGWATPGNVNINEMDNLAFSVEQESKKEEEKSEKKANSVMDVIRQIANQANEDNS